jgi:translation initiation factor 2 beta subunit (eIF-2beta)/eIF-5
MLKLLIRNAEVLFFVVRDVQHLMEVFVAIYVQIVTIKKLERDIRGKSERIASFFI